MCHQWNCWLITTGNSVTVLNLVSFHGMTQMLLSSQDILMQQSANANKIKAASSDMRALAPPARRAKPNT